ncbi:fimbria/pilus periplasmic chaperone [Sphingomonas sp.]|uniref:fimbrial biogenesis chaperone n=1 Tax=Sphingomonas sp. TaxID=28214 RepID=UPI0025E17AE8|nr:fimbria/pilus periplasmic chaperone [Sphingomonas sp.]
MIAGAALADPALAGSFNVNPVRINLPADRQTASLTIANSDAVAVAVRVIALEWTQVNGIDVHKATSNVIASPPIFTIAPGKAQLLRVGLKNRDAARAYRIILEEIPRQIPIAGQIQVTLRLDLPLYVLPRRGGKTDISWRAWRNAAGDLWVEGSNAGSLYGQVAELSAQQGAEQLRSTEIGVVLPGSARRWKMGKAPHLKVGLPLALKVRSPAGETQIQITLE